MKTRVWSLEFSFSRRVPEEWEAERADFRKLSGTEGYCSPEAAGVIREKIREMGCWGIHFLDTGNYHYLTKFFLEQIREPFCLAVFDRHTDMQPSALLPLLSCGNWLLETLRENRYLERVLLAGPPGEDLRQAEAQFRGRVLAVSQEVLGTNAAEELLALPERCPVYFSIDTDVLSREDARTNWDQGELRLDSLCRLLGRLGEGRVVLGADICGGAGPDGQPGELWEAEQINSRTDSRLLKCIDSLIQRR